MATNSDDQHRPMMTSEEIAALSKEHTIFEWTAQKNAAPIAVARAEGVYFWTPEGQRFIDFNSQLMSVNIGHGDRRVIEAIQKQAELVSYVAPSLSTEPRARLGAKLASIAPGDIDVFFFTNGGAEANETAFKIARAYTGRPKIISFYRSYHGGTAGALAATGEPRGWLQPQIPGFLHVLSPYHGIARGSDTAEDALRYLEEVIQLEGPQSIAAIIMESVVGTNGILIPPDGYYQGLRVLCDKYGILLIADEVMTGFGRTGAWFAVDHWNVVPDLITMAKGITSAYVPLGAVGMRRAIAEIFRDSPFPAGLTYNSHPLACAAALATIAVYEEDGLIDQARQTGNVMAALLTDLAARHPSVGAVRSLGLFGVVELVRSQQTLEPMAPFNSTSPEMAALADFFRREGLFTFVRWNYFFTNPPLCITEAELREGFAIIDRGLAKMDRRMEVER
jgi:taurine--2-oxoglutarate transaminase